MHYTEATTLPSSSTPVFNQPRCHFVTAIIKKVVANIANYSVTIMKKIVWVAYLHSFSSPLTCLRLQRLFTPPCRSGGYLILNIIQHINTLFIWAQVYSGGKSQCLASAQLFNDVWEKVYSGPQHCSSQNTHMLNVHPSTVAPLQLLSLLFVCC